MKNRLIALTTLAIALAAGFLVLDEIEARTAPGGVIEERVNANLVRVRINGRWEEFPLVPLAEHACHSGDEQLERYCE